MARFRGAVVAAFIASSVTLHGCGGGGGGDDGGDPDSHNVPTPTPAVGPPSPNSVPTPGPAPPATTTTTPVPEPCIKYGERPKLPSFATDLNGVSWPPACFEGKDVHHVFVIGDWGGMCGYGTTNDCTLGEKADEKWDTEDHSKARPYPMRNKRSRKEGVDQMAQQLVRDRMNELSDIVDPEFVINVGDNFYPGGVVEHCNGNADSVDYDKVPHQFLTTYENMYNGSKLQKKEWLSVLGNHDYGGVCFNMGWTQQIFYTWNKAGSQRWIMPAQYYSRQARFTTTSGEVVSADMFFLDSNFEDSDRDEPHDICSKSGNYHMDKNETQDDRKNGWYCKGFLGDWKSHSEKAGQCSNTKFTSREGCIREFKSMWHRQMRWLEKGLANSYADWQIIVTHYPPYYHKLAETLAPLSKKYGVDLIVTGHTHSQEIWYKKLMFGKDFGDTAVIISGGGGGILSESTPDDHGNDNQYGFMDLAITKSSIDIVSYSWADSKYGQLVLETDYSKCAGQYHKEHFGWPDGDWIRYRGNSNGCLLYYSNRKGEKGWVMKDSQNIDKELPYLCKGPAVPDLPMGDWDGNPEQGVAGCRMTVPKGDLMIHTRQKIHKVSPGGGGDDPIAPPGPEPLPVPTPEPPAVKNTCAAIGCGAAYSGAYPCQCNSQCLTYGNCCADYNECSDQLIV